MPGSAQHLIPESKRRSVTVITKEIEPHCYTGYNKHDRYVIAKTQRRGNRHAMQIVEMQDDASALENTPTAPRKTETRVIHPRSRRLHTSA